MKKQKKKDIPKNPKIKGLERMKNPHAYLDLIEWIAKPEPLREPRTQGEFAKKYQVGQDTISLMKQRDGFWDEVMKKRKTWGKERTPNVILGLYRKAIKEGNAGEVKLWLQVFEEFAEKTVQSNPEIEELAKAIKQIAKK